MRTTIDNAGRIVVPKVLRDLLGLVGGDELEIVEEDGDLRLIVPPTKMTLVEAGNAVVAVPERELPQLTDDIVRLTLDRVRR